MASSTASLCRNVVISQPSEKFKHHRNKYGVFRDTSPRKISCKSCNVVACAAVDVIEVSDGRSSQKFDVSSSCVEPFFRSSPEKHETGSDHQVKVLFLSEGNVCRSIFAEAIFNKIVRERGLQEDFVCASKATRDYNIGEAPDPRAQEVADELLLELPSEARAAMFNASSDIVNYDIAMVMDKFVAADVLKEVSVFDTINPQAHYSSKVRRLGDFCKKRVVEDIDDPLYGNMGGPDEFENLHAAYWDIKDSCEGLFEELLKLNETVEEGGTLKKQVNVWLRGMEDMDWMVPPMLQKRK